MNNIESTIAGMMIGVTITILCFFVCKQLSREESCSRAGGVLILDKCLDVKQIPMIESK